MRSNSKVVIKDPPGGLFKKGILGMVPILVFGGLIELLVDRNVLPGYLFPSPSMMRDAYFEDPASFWAALKETFYCSAMGLGLSVVFGTLLGAIFSFWDSVRRLFFPYAIFFQTIPIIAIAPLLVIWLGIGHQTVIASSFIVSFFPVLVNAMNAIASTDPRLLDLFALYRKGRLATFFQLRIPASLGQLFVGFRIAAGLSVIGSIVGEFISGTGIGGFIDVARNQQRVDRVFVALIFSSILGLVFTAVFNPKFFQRSSE